MTIETNIYDHEELHHNCLVQVLTNSITGEQSPAWCYDDDRTDAIMEYVCGEVCKYPSEYKDPYKLWEEKCNWCRLIELLEEEGDG